MSRPTSPVGLVLMGVGGAPAYPIPMHMAMVGVGLAGHQGIGMPSHAMLIMNMLKLAHGTPGDPRGSPTQGNHDLHVRNQPLISLVEDGSHIINPPPMINHGWPISGHLRGVAS